MKKISLFIITIFTISLSSCETDKKFNSHDFEGNYEMRTTSYWELEDGTYDKYHRDVISPVQIYIENEHLYIWTNSYGIPNMDTKDLTEIEYTYDPPVDPPTDGEGGEGIEDVTVTRPPETAMMNNFIIVIRDGKFIKSKPIKAQDVQVNKILFRNSEEFDIQMTDPTGTKLDVLTCHFEYAPATLLNDTITWDIELFGDVGDNPSNSDHFYEKIHAKYHNTLVRK